MNFKTVKKRIFQLIGRWSLYPLNYQVILSEKEKTLFDLTVKESLHYLEFGMGGSTLRAIQKSKARIYTVESSTDWISKMRRFLIIRFCELFGRLNIYHVDIGTTGEWGYPIGEEHYEKFPLYSSTVFSKIDKKMIDTVFIDGRFRVACVLKTILECHGNNRLIILIHDYQREGYNSVEKYLEIISSSETLFLFKLKYHIELDSVNADYEAFKYNPE